MIKYIENKKQVLVELFNEYKFNGGEDFETLRGYVECGSDNDPGFFRWLFDDCDISDFGFNLSDEQKQDYEEFLNKL